MMVVANLSVGCENVRLSLAVSISFEECMNIFKPKSPVTAAAKSVGLEQPLLTPPSDCIGMQMEKMSNF